MPTAQMETALNASVVTIFYAWKIVLPTRTLRLVDGAGFVTFDGAMWEGKDALCGVISAVEIASDGVAVEAPTLKLTFLVPTEEGSALLCSPTNQGAVVEMYEGVIDAVSGAVVPDPDLKFAGEIDVATLRASKGSLSVEVDVVSVWERMFEEEEGIRLSDAFQQSVAPGDLGLEFIASIKDPPIWGADGARPVATSSSSTSSSTGSTTAYLV